MARAAIDAVDERRCLLALALVPGLGGVRIGRLVEYFGSAAGAWAAPRGALLDVPGLGRAIAAAIAEAHDADGVDRTLRRAAACGARVVTWLDPGYPRRLRGIPASPPVLYVRGGWCDDRPAIAIVGTRLATPYGLGVAERLGAALVEHDVTVVSGLARGIDGAVHRAVVRAGGSTVGVLGCGVDVAYPPEHRSLMDAVIARGALVAEAPMGAAPGPRAFPARNRIISGLADGVVVVEGDVDSGAMITARQARAQGRAVFAVPGNVYARGSRGPHRLLATGARVVAVPDDILAVLASGVGHRGGARERPAAARTRGDLTPPERRVVDALEEGDVRSIDRVAVSAGLSVSAVAAALVALELRGIIRRTAGGLYTKIPSPDGWGRGRTE